MGNNCDNGSSRIHTGPGNSLGRTPSALSCISTPRKSAPSVRRFGYGQAFPSPRVLPILAIRFEFGRDGQALDPMAKGTQTPGDFPESYFRRWNTRLLEEQGTGLRRNG